MGQANQTLVYSRKKTQQRATREQLNDEIILDIIARLPLKYAVQCMLLNKKFFHWISDPSFLRRKALISSSSSLSSNTSIFHYSGNILTRITPKSSTSFISQVSATLPLQPSILASCNGVLLLRFRHHYSYYVFNPITGGIMHVDYPYDGFRDIGLAVDVNSRKFHFKLVTIHIFEQRIVRFTVLVPISMGGDGPSVLVKSEVDFIFENFTLMPDIYSRPRPVYVHGRLHWLANEGKKIIVFDMEEEKATIMNGPVEENEAGFHSGVDRWFGVVDGSLRFVYSLRDEIVIREHDYIKDEWQPKHKIANMFHPWDGMQYIFDGQRLFLKLQQSEEYGRIFVHDISRNKWEKAGEVVERIDCFQPFFSFSPTLAKVSDKYLHNYDAGFPSRGDFGVIKYREIKRSFGGLQRLMKMHQESDPWT